MGFFNLFNKKKEQPAARSVDCGIDGQTPAPVGIEQDGLFSDTIPFDFKNHNLFRGHYACHNFMELFYALPEVFAPVHEIASRVADATWQLRNSWNDEVVYTNKQFNRLFSKPNPLFTFKQFVYMAVVYEIVTGRQFFYKNQPEYLGDDFESVLTWWNLPAPYTEIVKKTNIDTYSATTLADIIIKYKAPDGFRSRDFPVENVLPVLNIDLRSGTDVCETVSLLLGAEKAIDNLLPVYMARKTIYVKRGAMGFLVSRKADTSGIVALLPHEKQEARDEYNKSYGLTGGRDTIGVASAPVAFEKTTMSIKEMEPFEETLADACAIYAVLRVPPHLVPRKDHSTFNNAAEDMKAFYTGVIIPMAQKYADLWTDFFKLTDTRKYIHADFSTRPELQENKKEAADVNSKDGATFLQAFQNGTATLNQWLISRDNEPVNNPLYNTYIYEMTPEQLEVIKKVINLKSNAQPDSKSPAPESSSV